MELTNREKLIIASVVISRQNFYVLGQIKRGDLLAHFAKAFDVNESEFIVELYKEQQQFIRIMQELVNNETLNIDCMFSNLDNREKFIFYSVSFLFQYLDNETYLTMVNAVAVLFYPMPNETITKLLEMVSDQINETFAYIEYSLENETLK